MTPQEFAQRVKQKYPMLAHMPDDVLVSTLMYHYPQYQQVVQGGSSLTQKLFDLIKQGVQKNWQDNVKYTAPAIAANPRLANTFRQFGPVDQFGRLWTPGVAKATEDLPTDDPFYYQHIQKIIQGLTNGPPQSQNTGVQKNQQAAP